MYARRSTRSFKDKAVEPEHLQMIIKAVSTAPMGLPPSDVEILIVQGREKVREFGDDIVGVMAKSKWMFSPLGRVLLRPFFGKELTEQAKTFLYPAILHFLKERPRGEDSLFYHAPLVMYFHVSVYADPADPLVSATYAMLAAESLGMGSCMIGTPAPFIKNARKLKEKYGIPPKNRQGIALILGYPQVKYSRSLKRSLAGVHFY
jgi:nitroreductase